MPPINILRFISNTSDQWKLILTLRAFSFMTRQNYLLLNVFFDDLFYQETISTPVTSFSSLLGKDNYFIPTKMYGIC